MADFTMPALGADMEAGKVVAWNVQAGDSVHAGDVVAVVETHKGAIDVECFLEGVIDNLVPLGTELPVGAVLANVHGTGDVPLVEVAPVAPSVPNAIVPSPSSNTLSVAVAAPAPGLRIKITPAARRRASDLGLAVAQLHGSGADHAVTLVDVVRAAQVETKAPAPESVAGPRGKGRFDPAQMRQAIAAAMGKSKREIPHYYLSSTVDFGTAQQWLDAWNAARPPVDRLLPAVLLLKATALALVEVPQLNGFYENGVYRASTAIHLGWAVALRGGGLVAPAIHHADRQSLPALMAVLRDLVQRARVGGLRSSEISDPTITVTSLGERGAQSVMGVIYPPQVAIVGFGRVQQLPWVVNGAVVPRPLVNVSLAADHRASDGHLGGRLLMAIDSALQTPERL